MNFPASTSLLAAGFLLFSGCATTTDPMESLEGVDIAKTWTAQASGDSTTEFPEVERGWLAQFEQSDLEALVEEALANNPGVRAASARLATAEAEARIAGADRLPSLGASASGSRQKFNSIGGGLQVQSQTVNQFNVGLQVAYEADIWGRLRDGTLAAAASAEAAYADFVAVRLTLVGQITRTWFDWTEAQQQLELARDRLQTFEANEQLIQSQFERGITDALSLRLIRAQTRSARAQVEQRETTRDQLARTLEVLAGRYPGNAWEMEPELPELKAAVPTGIPSDLLSRRPDILAAERRLFSADRNQQSTEKLRYPSFSLTGSGGTSSNELEDLLDSDFSVWSLAGNLTAPIFQGGRIQGQIDRSEAQRDLQEANYVDVVLNAFREVEVALAQESTLAAQEQHLRDAREESLKAEELAWERYQRGLVDIITVLESERRAFDAEINLISVSNLRLKNRVDLHLALGGDFYPAGKNPYTLAQLTQPESSLSDE